MNTSAAARDLSTDAAPLRINRDPQTRLRRSHYNGEDIVFVVTRRSGGAPSGEVGTAEGRVDIQSGLTAGDRIVVEGPDSLNDKTRVQEGVQ